MATPSAMPPMNFDMGSTATATATSGPAQGGSASGSGMGALNSGDWIIQTTGTGNNSAVPATTNQLLWLAIGAGVVWFLMRR